MILKELRSYIDKSNNLIYQIPLENKAKFSSLGKLKSEYVNQSQEFAFKMSISGEGYQKSARESGAEERENIGKFYDIFYGKLGEFACYQYLTEQGIEIDKPDLIVMGKDKWDEFDFSYNDKIIGVKNTGYYGNLLLLETKDWSDNAEYQHGMGAKKIIYDDFLFSRITPYEGKKKRPDIATLNHEDIDQLMDKVKNKNYSFDIHYVPIILVKEAIRRNMIIKSGGFLGSLATLIDVDNYYIQSGDMKNIREYIKLLKS